MYWPIGSINWYNILRGSLLLGAGIRMLNIEKRHTQYIISWQWCIVTGRYIISYASCSEYLLRVEE